MKNKSRRYPFLISGAIVLASWLISSAIIDQSSIMNYNQTNMMTRGDRSNLMDMMGMDQHQELYNGMAEGSVCNMTICRMDE